MIAVEVMYARGSCRWNMMQQRVRARQCCRRVAKRCGTVINCTSREYRCGNLWWSTSHVCRKTDAAVAAAISSLAPVGVDVEVITPRDPSLQLLFSLEEYNRVGGRSWEAFFRLWCAREAVIKARSLTLSALTTLCCTDYRHNTLWISGMGVSMKVFMDVREGVCMAVTVPPSCQNVQVWYTCDCT